jgi:hypothetical protein
MLPQLPPQVAGAGDALLNLLALLSDKAATETHIRLSRSREDAARQAIEEANKRIAEDEAAGRDLEKQRHAANAQLERERAAWQAEQTKRQAQLEKWEKEAQAALQQATKDRDAAAKLKADLEQRLAKMAQLAA